MFRLKLINKIDLFELLRSTLLLAICCALCSGCVRRRLTVRTNPPGATVYVDKQLIGTTPAASAFTYYGTRQIEVVADGFRTEKVLRKFSPPWYQYPPLDFFFETLWPFEVRDERVVDITMVPSQPLSEDELKSHAETLRLQAAQGLATGLPPTARVRDQEPIIIPPGTSYPPAEIYPNSSIGPVPDQVLPPTNNPPPRRQPGQVLRDLFTPGGERNIERIPETGILPGGGYRPPLPPSN